VALFWAMGNSGDSRQGIAARQVSRGGAFYPACAPHQFRVGEREVGGLRRVFIVQSSVYFQFLRFCRILIHDFQQHSCGSRVLCLP
jgi:hypothetical protein